MLRFDYSAVLVSGQRVKGTVRSQNRREALKELLGRGYHPLVLTEAGSGGTMVENAAHKMFCRVSTSDLAVFTRQLASLLKAGLMVPQALSTLGRQSQNKHLVKVLQEIEEALSREGGTLAEALDDHPRVFDAVYRGLVRAGEEGGKLTEVLNSLAKYLARSAKLRGQVLGAFIYPIVLLMLGAASVFVLMTFVIPRFEDLFRSLGQALPWPTRMLMGVSHFMAQWWWAVLVSVAALFLVISAAFRRPSVRERSHRFLLHLPVLGAMLLKLAISRLSRTLGTLLNNGVWILEALKISAAISVRNLTIRGAFTDMIKGVSQGEALATVAERAKLFTPLMVNLIRTGEESGELPQMLTELSDIYEDEAERAVAGAVTLLEPLLIVVLGGIVASIVAAVMLPIFQASAMVQ